MESSKFKLILGSQSPRRNELLSWLKIQFEIVTADLEEVSLELEPTKIAVDLALQKARAVVSRCEPQNNNFIIAADTIVVLDNKIYGKPKDRADAERILNELSGKEHQVITGVCFAYQNKVHSFYDRTDVNFNQIDSELMKNYLDTNDSLDKAGAYGIQGPSLTFISKLHGSYSNVVGFPLDKIVSELKELFGPEWRTRF